jgi:serine O-acetyltransferase
LIPKISQLSGCNHNVYNYSYQSAKQVKIVFKWYEEAKSIAERDPAARGVWQVIFQYPGFKAVRMYRRAHWFHLHGMYFIARAISQHARHKTGIEIHPGAKIGRCLFIDHGMGIVIGETAEIGDYCTIYHGVTLGGTGKDKGKRHPTIGNNVLISAGAKILGPFRVGDNAKIGANSVVLSEVEANTTVVGVPGRAVKRGGEKIRQSFELDQIHNPDPVSQEFCRIRGDMDKIKAELQSYEKMFVKFKDKVYPDLSCDDKEMKAADKGVGEK